jgi:hypothetical protein
VLNSVQKSCFFHSLATEMSFVISHVLELQNIITGMNYFDSHYLITNARNNQEVKNSLILLKYPTDSLLAK